jgi:hypothetical protein
VLFAAVSISEKIALLAAGTTVVGLAITAFNAWLSVANERKRTQPIVIAHEEYARQFAERAGSFSVGAYLTNEGSGTAFNVRFGVEFHGIRFPYKHSVADHQAGSVQRVIRSAERRPIASSWPIPVDAYLLIQEGGDPDPARVYWARYENAQGKVWETRNPGDRSARLDIRRVRAVRLHERLEEHRRIKARKRGLDWERKALAELPQVPEGAHEGQ